MENLTEEFELKFVKPIVNASYPGTLAALSLAVLQVSGREVPFVLKLVFATSATMFLLSAFSIFFYTIYPTKRGLWTATAITFLLGLSSSILSVLFLFIL